MNTTDRLRSHLSQQNDAIFPVGQGPEAAMAAGARIRKNRQIAMTSLSVVAIAVAGLAAFSLRFPSGSTEPDLAEPPSIVAPVAPSAASAVEFITNDIDWEVFDTTVATLEDALVWNGSFYALSTAPGKAADPNSPVQAIYTSSDGVSWSVELVGDDLWIADIDQHEGTLYAIGTSPGVLDNWTDRVEAQAAFTTDGGATWQKTDLLTVAVPPEDAGEVRSRGLEAHVAAGPKGVIGVVSTRYDMDFSLYIPEEYRSLESASVQRTADGIEVYDWSIHEDLLRACDEGLAQAEGGTVATTTVGVGGEPTQSSAGDSECDELRRGTPPEAIVFSATWSDLGIEAPKDHYSELFVSADGVDFEAVSSPFTDSNLSDLHATDDGFVAVGRVYSDRGHGWWIWSSPDGRTWNQLNLPSGLASFVSLGTVGDELVLVGYVAADSTTESREIVMFVSADDGTTWTAANLSDVFGVPDEGTGSWVSAIDIGPGGVTIGLFIEPPPRGEGPDTDLESNAYPRVFFSDDLTNWSELDLGELGIGPEQAYVGAIVSDGNTFLISGSVVEDSTQQRRFTLIGTSS